MRGIYITPADYAKAAENGVSEKQVYNRVNINGWSVERAITTPMFIQHTSRWDEFKALAEKNGVSYCTYMKRTYRGIDPEQAAGTPPKQIGRGVTVK